MFRDPGWLGLALYLSQASRFWMGWIVSSLLVCLMFYFCFTCAASYQNSQVAQSDDDPNNTTVSTVVIFNIKNPVFQTFVIWGISIQVFVGNLDSIVTDEHLRELFSQYGQLVHVKIPAGKRCGFVQFADRQVYLRYITA